MTPNPTRKFAGSAAQFFLGGLALALVTLICFVLNADLATTAFADLVVILVFSLFGNFVGAILLCLLSVASQAYFFAPPHPWADPGKKEKIVDPHEADVIGNRGRRRRKLKTKLSQTFKSAGRKYKAANKILGAERACRALSS